ncbi:hypothetical protein EST38_g6364 [Candolleomyces aberdarensis]|uniref:Uncharacterized protein n=1 Tax=Candolleomyces aberdarensis TaxID=2316362 RepID=A0A4Q2DK32_9AGAR|nr:hypothetical protein EST38_g6364 [Candolleomyces aberdarensis]
MRLNVLTTLAFPILFLISGLVQSVAAAEKPGANNNAARELEFDLDDMHARGLDPAHDVLSEVAIREILDDLEERLVARAPLRYGYYRPRVS